MSHASEESWAYLLNLLNLEQQRVSAAIQRAQGLVTSTAAVLALFVSFFSFLATNHALSFASIERKVLLSVSVGALLFTLAFSLLAAYPQKHKENDLEVLTEFFNEAQDISEPTKDSELSSELFQSVRQELASLRTVAERSADFALAAQAAFALGLLSSAALAILLVR